ncbi:LLM class flavin-dependent oxidoreductase [Streptomyces leeuwenhoekii]|uniref:LLM class flavin-dependent oxidoreductase n=1 Tax=Streptomyces leeuwenhoekii TaxID=1437453 RepID=UPI0036FDFDF0
MRYGIVILPEHRWPVAREHWRRAEEFGFDHAWTHDHLMWRWLREEPWFGCVPTLTAAATVTSRIGLGTLVATPEYRHPVTFAKEMMTLDDISQGRLVCGLGSGAGGHDERVLGKRPLSPGRRHRRFEEFVALTDRLLRDRETSYHGDWYDADGAWMLPGCLQRPRVPLAIAAAGPRSVRLAARYADIWLTNGTPGRFDALPYRETLPLLRRQSAAVEEACAETGRDVTTLRRMLVTGATVGGVLASAAAFEDAAGLFAEAGFTDLVVTWPRDAHPYKGKMAVLERVAETLTRTGGRPTAPARGTNPPPWAAPPHSTACVT